MKWIKNHADFDVWCDAAKQIIAKRGHLEVEDDVAEKVSNTGVFEVKNELSDEPKLDDIKTDNVSVLNKLAEAAKDMQEADAEIKENDLKETSTAEVAAENADEHKDDK